MILSGGAAPMLLTCRSGGFEAMKCSDLSKNQKEMQSLMIDNSCTPAENLLLMVELRKKILTFRDIIDLPPCDDRGPLNELVIGTVEDLHKLYPKVVPSIPTSELDGGCTNQVLSKLYNALTSIGNSWVNNHKWLSKFKYEKEGDMKNISLAQLGDKVLAKLDYMIMVAREMFDVMDEDGNKSDESPRNSTFGDILHESYSDIKASHCQSPVTPTSVIPEFAQSFADVSYSPPLLWPLRLQAVGKLKPIDVKRLSFHMFPHVVSCGSSPQKERNIIDEVKPEKKRARSSTEMLEVIDNNVELKDYTVLQSNLNASPTPKAPPLPPPTTEIRKPKALSQPMLPLPNLSVESHTVWQTMLPKVFTGRPTESLMLQSNVSRASYPSLAMAPLDVFTLSPQIGAIPARPSSPPKLVPNAFTAPPPPPMLQKSTFAAPPSTLSQNASVPPPPPPTLTKNASAAPTVPVNARIPPSPPPPPMLPLNASMSPSVAPPMAPPNSSKAPPPSLPPMLRPTSSTMSPSSPPPLPPKLQTNASTALPPLPPPMLRPNESTTTPPPPMLQAKTSTAPPPPPPPMLQSNASTAPLPPPPMLSSRGSVPLPPPPMSNGSAPPPPPPGAGRVLRPKKANTKLKRSSQMGNLYRVLKGKLEGCNQDSKASTGRKNVGGAPCAGGSKQSMADALAEMTKRSSYFQQIEEDVQKHAKTVMEMKTAINSFQTSDMAELLKFHQHVESHLEKLTDETQVLARFEDFPSKKLETLRTAAALYSKVNAMLTNLTTWKIETPLAGTLDKVENYFNKIKGELEALERTKDEESKRFQSHKITFDFHILVRIKESVVDLSSSCMEFALKERREAKVATDGDTGPKADKRLKACTRMLWRAFQLAYRVYTFAGGHDDRADMLSRELAQEIESDPHH